MPWKPVPAEIDWSAVPEAAAPRLSARQHRAALAAGALVVGVVLGAAVVRAAQVALRPGRLDACAILPARELARIAGITAPPAPFEPEGTTSTGCNYGRGASIGVTVFAVSPGGRQLVRLQERAMREHGTPVTDLGGSGYVASLTVGPREGSESVVVLRGDRYVNVVVYGAPPGTAAQLVPVAARSLG